MVKMAPNNNNDEIASSTSSLSNISKNMISSILPNSPLGGANANYVEGRNTKISPQNSDDCPREGTPSPPTTKASAESYHTIRYAHLSSTEKLDYTTLKSKHRTGRRCYRLNLERPFNIHCEQSPLEYGDIFAPWTKSVRPKTEGPSEYCPPRHLGGGGDVWRRLVSFGQQQLLGRGSDKKSSSNKDGEGEANLGWRKLNPAELRTVQRLGEMNSKGEYAFMTYDLSHVKHHPHLMNKSNNGEDGDNGGGGGGGGGVITPSTSVDSLDSTDSNPKSAIAKANETARLFRRSELSLRDKAEEAARIEAAEQARLRMERKEKEQAELDALKSVKGAKGVSRRMSKRASFGGKKMMRKLSSSMGSSTGGGGSSSTIRTMSGTGIYEGGAGARRKLVSTQAGMIEKAKDVIDEESNDEYDGEKVSYQ